MLWRGIAPGLADFARIMLARWRRCAVEARGARRRASAGSGHPSVLDAAGRAAVSGVSGHLDRRARRGGGRRRSDRPGAEVLWRVFQPLGDLTTMYGIMRRDSPQWIFVSNWQGIRGEG